VNILGGRRLHPFNPCTYVLRCCTGLLVLNEGERSESNGIRWLRGCFLLRVRTGPSLDVGVTGVSDRLWPWCFHRCPWPSSCFSWMPVVRRGSCLQIVWLVAFVIGYRETGKMSGVKIQVSWDVALWEVVLDISKDRSACVFWDKQPKKTGRYAMWLVIVSDVLNVRAANLRNVDNYDRTWRNVPEDVMLQRHRCEKLYWHLWTRNCVHDCSCDL